VKRQRCLLMKVQILAVFLATVVPFAYHVAVRDIAFQRDWDDQVRHPNINNTRVTHADTAFFELPIAHSRMIR